MIVNCLLCHDCNILVFSRARHDLRHCECSKCFIDGGRDYVRIGYETADSYTLGKLFIEIENKVLIDDWNKSNNKYGLVKDWEWDETENRYFIKE